MSWQGDKLGRSLASQSAMQGSPKCYPCSRKGLWTGIVCTTGFILIGTGSFLTAYLNVDNSFQNPKQSAFLYGAFWSAWTVLGVFMIWSAVKSRVILTPEYIEQVGCFRVKTIPWGEIANCRWRLFPDKGSLVLKSSRHRMVIEFAMFDPALKTDLITRLHEGIYTSFQEGWESFESRWLKPPVSRPGAAWGVFALSTGFLAVFTLLFLLLGRHMSEKRCLVLGIISAACCIWTARMTFRELRLFLRR